MFFAHPHKYCIIEFYFDNMTKPGPIGVFDSGYGGLTVLREIVKDLPQYDYLYLGDNARAPYGNRSFDTVYQYTLECVKHLFDKGCRLVILACNTASAKALRTIQQKDLPQMDPGLRVLGVIRPTTEIVGKYSKTGAVGVVATSGTVSSGSYVVEIEKFFPGLKVFQEACPMWVPLVENNEFNKPGADYFIRQHLEHLFGQSADIDTLLLGCTHYPLLMDKIRALLPKPATILSQGEIVSHGLQDYLLRHPEMEAQCSKTGSRIFYTTDDTETFNKQAAIFFGQEVNSVHLAL
jgi:glutamate racemase